MWREAAGANLAVAGFVLILAFTNYHYGPGGVEGVAIIASELVLAAFMTYLAAAGSESISVSQGDARGSLRERRGWTGHRD
jgi:hypothetical protein